jgi:two-component sensor histidine kinase
MSYDDVVTYGCDPAEVGPARRWTECALVTRLPGDATAVVDDAVLVVSELLTNAIRASCSAVSIGIAVEADAVRVAVRDDAQGVPTPRQPDPAEPAGRGLTIVAAVARQWGVRPCEVDGREGKEVWARLSLSR